MKILLSHINQGSENPNSIIKDKAAQYQKKMGPVGKKFLYIVMNFR